MSLSVCGSKNKKMKTVFSGVRVSRSLVLCVCFVDRYLSFCTFSLTIVLSVLLRYTDSDYPFGIFKLFLNYMALQSFDISLPDEGYTRSAS